MGVNSGFECPLVPVEGVPHHTDKVCDDTRGSPVRHEHLVNVNGLARNSTINIPPPAIIGPFSVTPGLPTRGWSVAAREARMTLSALTKVDVTPAEFLVAQVPTLGLYDISSPPEFTCTPLARLDSPHPLPENHHHYHHHPNTTTTTTTPTPPLPPLSQLPNTYTAVVDWLAF